MNERQRPTLELLSRHGVDLVVVGGVAAVLQGVPLVTFELGGLTVPVLALPRLIELKEATGRPKDLAAPPTLRATLEEIRRRG